MKAELWKIEVGTAGALSISHSWAKAEILEVFIPKYNIAFNNGVGHGDKFNCFKVPRKSSRYKGLDGSAEKIRDLEIDDELVEKIKNYFDAQKCLGDVCKWFNKETNK